MFILCGYSLNSDVFFLFCFIVASFFFIFIYFLDINLELSFIIELCFFSSVVLQLFFH